MITEMTGMPETVAAFRVTGKVTAHDYETVVIPGVNKVAGKYGKVRLLMLLETDISNYSISALFDDFRVGISHFTHWEKMAIVTDQEGVSKISEITGKLIPGETRSFTTAQLKEAEQWVAA